MIELVGFPYWFYYFDFVGAGVSYFICVYVSGYFSPQLEKDRQYLIPFLDLDFEGEDERWFKKRRKLEGLEGTISEMFVTGLAIAYGVILMPIYRHLDDTYKIIWRLTVHPLYWEIVVKALSRQILLKKAGEKLNVLHSLLMVHGIYHSIR